VRPISALHALKNGRPLNLPSITKFRASARK